MAGCRDCIQSSSHDHTKCIVQSRLSDITYTAVQIYRYHTMHLMASFLTSLT